MTTHELAKQLLDGPDLMVTIPGYEGGVNEVETINKPTPILLNKHTEWYYGKHEYIDEYMSETSNILAVHIE
jgi:hypothetical protein